jgi:hypothetical protein
MTSDCSTVTIKMKKIVPLSVGAILYNLTLYIVGRDSAVGTATRTGVDGPRIECRYGRDFLHPSRPALGPNQPSIKWVPGLCPRVKAAGVWC